MSLAFSELDTEWFPTQTAAIPEDNPFRRKVRRLTHEVGMKIFARRIYEDKVNPIGVHYWAWHVAEQMTHDRNEWRWIPEVSEIRRRINELADVRCFSPTPWVRLSKDYEDVAPNIPFGTTVKLQSSYIPNLAIHVEYAELLSKFVV